MNSAKDAVLSVALASEEAIEPFLHRARLPGGSVFADTDPEFRVFYIAAERKWFTSL